MVVGDFCSAHIIRSFKLKKIKTLQMLINRRKPPGKPREKKNFYYQIKLSLRITFLLVFLCVCVSKDNNVVQLKIKVNFGM